MKKIKKMLIPLTVFSLAIGICTGILFNNHETSSADNIYSITFDSKTNHFHNESTSKKGTTDDIKTASGQKVSFSYTNVIGQVNESWHVIDSNGSFQNTSRINGISNLTIKFKTPDLSFKIEWSKDIDFADKHLKTYTSSDNYTYCGFENYSPNYFRLVNTSGSLLDIESMKLNFSCVIKYPTVKITNSDYKKGYVYSTIVNGEYEALTNFKISATGKNGYTFEGWYDPRTNEKYSSDLILDLTLMNEDIYLEARYKEITDNKYQVFALVGDNGSVEGTGEHSVGDNFNLISKADDGFYSLGWFGVDDYQSEDMKNSSFTITSMPEKDLCYVTKFAKLYNIDYSVGTGEGTISGPKTAIEGQEVTCTANPNFDDGYAFNLWKDSNYVELSKDNVYTFIMPNHDLYLIATFTKGEKFTAFSSNTNFGTVTGSGYYLEGRNVRVNATPIGDYVFNGWYSDSGYLDLLTKEASYTFPFSPNRTSLYAKFWTKGEEEEEKWNKNHGVIPVISEDGKTLTYGLYPQSHVNDPSLIAELEKNAPDADEEYFIYNNEYYVKDTGNPYLGDYTFMDKTVVEKGATYYFKCEPITWNIVSFGDNYIIDCSNILYAHRFDDNLNSYIYGELRTWLVGDFYNKAFSVKDTSSYIVPTDLIDVEVTGDKVWVGSLDQYGDQGWYSSDSARKKKVSDFAICNHVYIYTSEDNNRYGSYWTRSPKDGRVDFEWSVSNGGGFSYGSVYYLGNGCSPALTINI